MSLKVPSDKIEALAEESVEILLALLARGFAEYPYAEFELEPEYFDPREIDRTRHCRVPPGSRSLFSR